MAPEYDIELLDRPGLTLSVEAQSQLRTSLHTLGALCLSPLPTYQVFDPSPSALDDKLILTARQASELVGFVSLVILPARPGHHDPVIHTGLTCIHPSHRRRAGLVKRLFAHALLHLAARHPRGVWVSSLAAVPSSLVHIHRHFVDVFPAPHSRSSPSPVHLRIARDISARHRDKMCVSPDARFDEECFIFRGANKWPKGEAFRKDANDERYWHRDREACEFYRDLLGEEDAANEVLQVAFLSPGHLKSMMMTGKYREDWGGETAAKL